MPNIYEAIQEAAKKTCDASLSDHQAHVVFTAMGHHRSIKFKDYAALDRLRTDEPAAFDELVRKTTGVMQHYDFSLEVFDMALRHHDPKKNGPVA